MADSNTNQRVTNAILQKDIENLGKRFEDWQKEAREAQKKETGRLRAVETHTTICDTLWTEHKTTHQGIDDAIKDVKGDVKKWSLFGGGGGGLLAFLVGIFVDR
jgi:hypothetical protein